MVVPDALVLAPSRRACLTGDIVRRPVRLILNAGRRPRHRLPSERVLLARLAIWRSSLCEAIKTPGAPGTVAVRVDSGTFVAEGDASMLFRRLSWGPLMGEQRAT
jgi:DNA-binding FadR family transcriptional regulator